MPAHQPGKSSTSFLRSRSATLTPEPLIIARFNSFWSGIHDDGKDVDIRSCAKSFDRPPEAFAWRGLFITTGIMFHFGGPKVAKLRAIHFAEKSTFATLRPIMKTFENKTVLITGGNSGIGKATVLAFAKEGANVVISGRRIAEGEKLAKEITSAGGSALFVRTDVTREDDIV